MGAVFGWDVSTSIIGVSLFDELGAYRGSDYLDLRKAESFMQKCDMARSCVDRHVRAGEGRAQVHYVEDRLGSFAAGRTMLQVLMKLAAFNAVVSWLIHERGCEVSHIHPSRVKSVMRQDGLIVPKGSDKKELTLAHVRSVAAGFPYEENRNGRPQPWCYDMADAFCVGRAGILSAKT